MISTNTFNSTAVSQSDYGMEALVRRVESRRRAARAARSRTRFAAPRGRPRFVAGALGPTSRTASLSPDVNDPGFRNVDFDELAAATRRRRARWSRAASM